MKIYEKRVTIRLFILSTVAGSCIGAYCEYNNNQSRCCNNFQMINGKCEACQAGYFGVECSSICPYGFYGIACQRTCLCAYGSICLPNTGCDCDHPPVITNGNALFTSTYPGSKAFYNCNEGYIGTWMNSISCLENGTWKNTSSTCRRIDCGSPPVVENTRSLYKSTLYGSSTVYICNKGYVLFGNDTIKCLRNASWELQSFECRFKDCRLPPSVENGEIHYTSTSYGSIAVYVCNNGYVKDGNGTVQCLANGAWEHHSVECHPKDCGPPPNVSYSMTTYNSTTFGSYAYIICFKNFIGTGINKIICRSDGEWEEQHYLCSTEKENSTNGNMLYFVGVTVVVFTVIIVSMVMIFLNRFKSFSKRYKGVAYISNASNRVENLMYTDLHEYYEIGNIPDQSPVTLVSVSTSNLEITPSNV